MRHIAEHDLRSGATGYYVYQADLGTNTLEDPGFNNGYPTGPVLTLSGSNLPTASLITSFIDTTKSGEVATAPSGGIFEADGPSPTPEPSSVLLLGTMAFGAAALLRRKIRQA